MAWEAMGFRLAGPDGLLKQLDVDGDMPVLGADDRAWPLEFEGAHAAASAVATAPVHGGVAEEHRQAERYSWGVACEVCVMARQRSRQRRRQQPDDDTLAVDLVAHGVGGPIVRVGTV